MADWYSENIEEPLREIVRALRNAGVNTTNSCGHEMYICCDWRGAPIDAIRQTLVDLKVREYKITGLFVVIQQHWEWGELTIWLPKPDGSYSAAVDYTKVLEEKLMEAA
jgi:hypothetical protein